MRQRIVVLQSDCRPEFFEGQRNSVQLEKRESELSMRLVILGLLLSCHSQMFHGLRITAEVVVTPAQVMADTLIIRTDASRLLIRHNRLLALFHIVKRVAQTRKSDS